MREDLRLAVVSPSRISPLAQMYCQMARAQLSWLCTTQPQSIFAAQPGIAARTTSDFSDLIEDDQLDAVAFDLDVASRGDWPKQALLAEKHVFVAGPLAATSAEVAELAKAAVASDRRLRAYLPAVYTGGAAKLRALIARGTLGEIHYLRGSVTCPSDPEIDLLLNAAPDLVGLILDLLADQPIDVVARSEAYVHPSGEDTIDAQLRFATGIDAHVHLSRIDSRQTARLTVVGSRLTATLDWRLQNGLALHGAGRSPLSDDLLDGGVIIPPIPTVDPLQMASESFLTSIRSNAEHAMTQDAAAVVCVLETIRSAYARPSSAAGHTDGAVVELHGR